MLLKVQFTCEKDPVLAKAYEAEFGELFTEQANADLDPIELRQDWKNRMTIHAQHHEHYDFYEDDEGVRHPLYEDEAFKEGKREHLYLIPEVTVAVV